MSAWPSWALIDWRELGEEADAVVERTAMDRGIAKQRRVQSDARVEVQVTVHFDSAARVADFEAWVYSDLHGGVDWFDWVHPRTGATVQARIVGGKLGKLSYLSRTLTWAKRTVALEYVRAAY